MCSPRSAESRRWLHQVSRCRAPLGYPPPNSLPQVPLPHAPNNPHALLALSSPHAGTRSAGSKSYTYVKLTYPIAQFGLPAACVAPAAAAVAATPAAARRLQEAAAADTTESSPFAPIPSLGFDGAGNITLTFYFGYSTAIEFPYGFNTTIEAPAKSVKFNIEASGW